MATKEEIAAAEAERQKYVKALVDSSSSPAKYTAYDDYTKGVRNYLKAEVETCSDLEAKLSALQAEPPKKEGSSLKRLFGKKKKADAAKGAPDDGSTHALAASRAKLKILQDEFDKKEKTRSEVEYSMNEHLGTQMALDSQAAFQGWFGTPDSPEHEAAMPALFKARDTYDKIVIAQCGIGYAKDALSKAEKSLGEVLSQLAKPLDARSGGKHQNIHEVIATQDLAEAWVWVKLAGLSAGDASNALEASTLEQALLPGSLSGNSAAGVDIKTKIQKYHTDFEHLRSRVLALTNELSEKEKALEVESLAAHEAVAGGLTVVQDLRWKMFLDKANKPEEADTAQS